MNKKILGFLGGLVLTLALVTNVSAAGFQNGSFENGTETPGAFLTLSTDSTAITGWEVDGSIDYIQHLWQATNGNRSIDLNGVTTGSIRQTFDTVPGAIYTVTFDMSGNFYGGNAKKDMEVTVNGLLSELFTYDTTEKEQTFEDMKYEGKTYTFTASGTSTELKFQSIITGAYGPVLDNVVIRALPGNKDQCKKGGWESFGVFKNQGDCVSFIATKGKNLPALEEPEE